MNPLLIEQALVTALTASAFTTTPVYAGVSFSELPPESPRIIVGVTQLEHVVGGLYKAHTDIKVEAPALLGSSEYDLFSGILETLRSSLEASYFTTNWPSESAASFGGLFVQSTDMSDSDHLWVATIKVIVGCSF